MRHKFKSKLVLTLKTPIFSVSMKVPLLSLVATETEELKKTMGKTMTVRVHQLPVFIHIQSSQNCPFCILNRYSRHNLCVVDQVLQRVAAGEVVVKICRVADQPRVRPGGVYVPCDDNRLDTKEAAEGTCGVWGLIHNLGQKKTYIR